MRACPPARRSFAGDAERLARLVSRFAPVLLALTAVPAIVAFAGGDGATGWRLAPGILLSGAGAWLTARLPPPDDAREAEDAAAVALAFVLGALVSSWPYLAHGLSPLDGLFEGVSGITSTGLSRYADIGAQPFGLKFSRAWQEWIGGYALVTLTVGLLARAGGDGGGGGAEEMAQSDVADDGGGDGEDQPDMAKRSRRVTVVYVLLTLACVGAVWAGGQSVGFAVLHGLTAVSTGGFAGQSGSLTGIAPATVIVLMGFSVLGAAALSDYARPLFERCGFAKLAATLGAVLALSALCGGFVLWAEGGGVGAYQALQVATSAQTTTGYYAASVPDMTDASKLALTASMLVGGDVGSTAGGLKLARLAALGVVAWTLLRAGAPGEQKREEAGDAIKLAAWWAALTALGWPALIAAGHPPVDALFEWVSALNNVGLSSGVSGGEDVPVLTRWVLIAGMWLGRVEILAATLALRAAAGR